MGELKPGDPVVVTSREPDFETIEWLVREHARLAAISLTARQAADPFAARDSAFCGYFYSRLWQLEALTNSALSTELFFAAIGSPAIPPEAWREIAEDIVLSFALLQNALQESTVMRFSQFATSPDVQLAFAGFRGLGKIASFAPASISSADTTTGLADAYRHLVKQDGMPRERALEPLWRSCSNSE
jgi:hypothetical protein